MADENEERMERNRMDKIWEVFDKFPVLERVILAFKGNHVVGRDAGSLEGSWLDRGLERCVILRPGGFLRAEKNRRSRLL